jgi:hypothetical protein
MGERRGEGGEGYVEGDKKRRRRRGGGGGGVTERPGGLAVDIAKLSL